MHATGVDSWHETYEEAHAHLSIVADDVAGEEATDYWLAQWPVKFLVNHPEEPWQALPHNFV